MFGVFRLVTNPMKLFLLLPWQKDDCRPGDRETSSKAARKCWSSDSNPDSLTAGSEVLAIRLHHLSREAFNAYLWNMHRLIKRIIWSFHPLGLCFPLRKQKGKTLICSPCRLQEENHLTKNQARLFSLILRQLFLEPNFYYPEGRYLFKHCRIMKWLCKKQQLITTGNFFFFVNTKIRSAESVAWQITNQRQSSTRGFEAQEFQWT